jgi:hypothetical protein
MKRKQGKTKGATSFLSVSLADLNEILKPEALVLVSRKFAETLGLHGERVTTSTGSLEGRQEMQSHESIEFKSEDLSEF